MILVFPLNLFLQFSVRMSNMDIRDYERFDSTLRKSPVNLDYQVPSSLHTGVVRWSRTHCLGQRFYVCMYVFLCLF